MKPTDEELSKVLPEGKNFGLNLEQSFLRLSSINGPTMVAILLKPMNRKVYGVNYQNRITRRKPVERERVRTTD